MTIQPYWQPWKKCAITSALLFFCSLFSNNVTAQLQESHTVQKGETLFSIARRRDIRLSTLMQANNLNVGSVLQIGQMLKAPSPPSALQGTYTVRKGDNASSISRRFEIKTKALLYTNGLTENSILGIGDKLLLPPAHIPGRPLGIVVTGSVVNIRSGPSLQAPKVGTVRLSSVGSLLGAYNGWAHVQIGKGINGWIHTSLIKPLKTGPASNMHATNLEGIVRYRVVNIRAKPGINNKIVSSLPKGEKVEVLGQWEGWYQVNARDEINGWIKDDLLHMTQTKPVPIAHVPWLNDPNSHPFVATANVYCGVPYQFGGSTDRGFDCSGLVHFVLKRHEIEMPRSARAMFEIGTAIKKNNLEPGDLVFFKNTYRRGISHVGIYTGNGKFIHASSGAGSVILSHLNNSYYSRHYAGSRRVPDKRNHSAYRSF